MVKRRTDNFASTQQEDVSERIRTFIDSADSESLIGSRSQNVDQDAIRDFKSIRVPFNEYEYRVLDEAAKRSGRSKLNFIRWAILQMSKID